MHAFAERHGPAIAEAKRAFDLAWTLEPALLEIVWGLTSGGAVSAEQVRHAGFDPAAPAPDLDDW